MTTCCLQESINWRKCKKSKCVYTSQKCANMCNVNKRFYITNKDTGQSECIKPNQTICGKFAHEQNFAGRNSNWKICEKCCVTEEMCKLKGQFLNKGKCTTPNKTTCKEIGKLFERGKNNAKGKCVDRNHENCKDIEDKVFKNGKCVQPNNDDDCLKLSNAKIFERGECVFPRRSKTCKKRGKLYVKDKKFRWKGKCVEIENDKDCKRLNKNCVYRESDGGCVRKRVGKYESCKMRKKRRKIKRNK